jgi:5-methylcytosine-specific restriction protein A
MVKLLKPRIKTIQTSTVKALTVSESQRTRGSRWVKIRRRVLTRDNGMCCMCKAHGRFTLAREVDHITPLWAGGTDAESNLQALCIECHASKTDAEASKRASGAF